MQKKIGPELTLFFLLMVAFCSEASVVKKYLFTSSSTRTWTDARLYCQNFLIDLVTGSVTGMGWLADILLKGDKPQAWVGLHRDPKNDSVWRWINLITGEGLAKYDVSGSSNWASGQQSGHCAFVANEDLMWSSKRCSLEKPFYCTQGGKIIHHTIMLSWYKASLYCKQHMGYLSTISRTNNDQIDKRGWIGLYREFGETWRWVGPESSDFTNWAEGEPVTKDCAALNATSALWESQECSERLNFACFEDNLVLVKENKTWEDAQNHCREMTCPSCLYRYDLVNLESSKDFSYIRGKIYKATTDEVWTGLRFLGGRWWWVDGELLNDHGQLPVCPSQEKHCGILSKHSEDKWITRDCSEKRNFICYKHLVNA